MSAGVYVIAVDIGTTTIRSYMIDPQGNKVADYSERVDTIYTTGDDNETLVEIDPDNLFEQFCRVIRELENRVPKDGTIELAICTQRNSIVLWNKKTRIELSRIIAWNDKRANSVCAGMNNGYIVKALNCAGWFLHLITRKNRFLGAERLKFLGAMVSHRLMVTIKKSDLIKGLYKDGNLEFGTLENWLLMRSRQENQRCVEASNISPSGMFDPWINQYNYTVLKMIGFPTDLLVPVVDSTLSEMKIPPMVGADKLGKNVPIRAILADQQAAMFGCGSLNKGDVKISLGTGTFVNIHTGSEPHASMKGLYPLIGWKINKKTTFIVEGNSHDTATVIRWAHSIGLFEDITATSDIAKSVKTTNGTVFVPAFCGLQTPINDEKATCAFLGLHPDTTKAHMVRAILESIAFRVYQIFSVAEREIYINENAARICGGVSNNNFVCQCIADLINRPVERIEDSDHVAARGVAMMAGIATGRWTLESLCSQIKVADVFTPCKETRKQLLENFKIWEKAVGRCLSFYD